MANIKIVIINSSTALTDNQVQAAVPALQTQIHRDFAPAWGTDVDLTFVPQGEQPPPGSWWLGVFDNSDQAAALGYHDLTPDGLPLGKIFAGADLQDGEQRTVTARHELLEMLGDPDINLTAFVQSSDTAGTLCAYEVCDACEADNLGHTIDGVLMSDFVYPAWFEAFRQPGSARFDQPQQITGPFQLLAGGYIGVFNVASGAGWSQQTVPGARQEYKALPRVGSRRQRRVTSRVRWLRSALCSGTERQ